MEIDGQSYTVYRVDNTIPYASGIEIYQNGREVTERREIAPVISRLAAKRTLNDVDTSVSPSTVTSRSAAEQQFTVVGWEVAANELNSGDIQQLRQISATAEQIDRIVSPPLSAINSVLNLFQQMRNTGAFGVTVWDLATSAYPQLPQYEEALSAVRTELSEWNSAAEQVSQNVNPAIKSLEKARQGQKIDYGKVSTQMRSAAEALERLQSKSNEVESSLSTASEESGDVAEALSDSRVPSGFVRPISQLSDRLRSAASEVDSFSETLGESESRLASVRSTAQSKQQQLMQQWQSDRATLRSQWKARQSAQPRVYGTLGGGGAGLVGILLLGRHLFQ
jgi:DNA repair exonuclease SbcCD ATPase subunit